MTVYSTVYLKRVHSRCEQSHPKKLLIPQNGMLLDIQYSCYFCLKHVQQTCATRINFWACITLLHDFIALSGPKIKQLKSLFVESKLYNSATKSGHGGTGNPAWRCRLSFWSKITNKTFLILLWCFECEKLENELIIVS